MLKPDQTEKELRKVRVADPKGRRLARAGELPEPLRPVAYGMLQCNAAGETVKGEKAREKLLVDALLALEELSAADRTLVFGALCPGLEGPLEGAWTLLEHGPYSTGWERRAFRAPGNRDVIRPSRQRWLTRLLDELKGYEQDVVWLAAWTPHLFSWWAQLSVPVLAAALGAGGPEGEAVRDVLTASARGEHPVGIMGRHVTGALLCSPRPGDWEYVERMLLAAQREEGLHQVILESVDEAHPEAFRRMVRLILEHDLLRFSAALRAVDV